MHRGGWKTQWNRQAPGSDQHQRKVGNAGQQQMIRTPGFKIPTPSSYYQASNIPQNDSPAAETSKMPAGRSGSSARKRARMMQGAASGPSITPEPGEDEDVAMETDEPPHKQPKRSDNDKTSYTKSASRMTMDRPLYEVKLLSLIFLRAIGRGDPFFLGTKMAAAGAFDDVIIRTKPAGQDKWSTTLVQLKHKESGKLSASHLCSLGPKSDFGIVKNCVLVMKISNNYNSEESDWQWKEEFDGFRYILYTNMKADDELKERETIVEPDEMFSSSSEGSVFHFNQNSETFKHVKEIIDFKDLLEQLKVQTEQMPEKETRSVIENLSNFPVAPQNKELQAKITKLLANPTKSNLLATIKDLAFIQDSNSLTYLLENLYVYTGQSREAQLDAYISEEIKRACHVSEEADISTLQTLLLDSICKWWGDKKPLGSWLTEDSDIWKKMMSTRIAQLSSPKVTELRQQDVTFGLKSQDLLTTVRAHRNLNIVVEDGTVPLVTAQVRHALTRKHYNDYIFTGAKELLRRKHEMLAVWQHRVCQGLVIDSDQPLTDEETNDLATSLSAVFKSQEHMVIILISTESNKLSLALKLELHQSRVVFQWKDLSSETQDKLLLRSVDFQGHQVSLSSLVGHDVDRMNELLRGSALAEMFYSELKFGQDLEAVTEDFISRRLRRDQVDFQLCDVSDRVVLLIAEPGMGKTTLMTHLAQQAKMADPTTWVVRINANDSTAQLAELASKRMGRAVAVDFLTQFARRTDTKFEEVIFKNCLYSLGKVTVLMDGIDEVCPVYEDTIGSLLKQLLGTNIQKIWATSRNIAKVSLERSLDISSYNLEAFSLEDRNVFIGKYYVSKDRRDHFIKSLDASIVGNLVTAIPQLTRVAVEYHDQSLGLETTLKRREGINPLKMMERFIEKKLTIYSLEKKKDDNSKVAIMQAQIIWKKMFMDKCMLAALHALLSEKELSTLIPNQLLQENEVDSLEKTGIVGDVVDSKPQFVHRTFAEYFAALWMVQHWQRQPVTEFIQRSLFEPRFKTVRMFLDLKLCESFELHKAVINSDIDHVRDLLQHGYDVSQTDDAGRTALHLAVTYNSVDVTRLLLDCRADINVRDDLLQWRPVQYAYAAEAWSVMKLLLESGADPTFLTNTNQIANREVFEELVKFMSHPGGSSEELARLAKKHGDRRVLKYLGVTEHAHTAESEMSVDELASTSAHVSKDASSMSFKKVPGAIDFSAQRYEIKICALLLMRGINHTDGFFLGSNVASAGRFDDVVFKYKPRGEQEFRSAFIQIKANPRGNKIIVQSDLYNNKSPYNMYKNYLSSLEVKNNIDASRNSVFDCSFANCDFILYTNARMDRSLGEPSSDHRISSRTKLFASTKNTDQPLFLADSTIKEVLDEGEKLSRKNHSDSRDLTWTGVDGYPVTDFLKRFQLFTNQALEKDLDSLIEDEIKKALECSETDARCVAKTLVEAMQVWWEGTGESEVLTEHSSIWSDVIASRIQSLNQSMRREMEPFSIISYTEQEIDSFHQSLSSSAVRIVKTRDAKLIGVKINQMLEKYHKDRFIFVTQADLLSRKLEVLRAWQSAWCDVLAVECSTDAETLGQELSKASPKKKLILLSENSSLTDCYQTSWRPRSGPVTSGLHESRNKTAELTYQKEQGAADISGSKYEYKMVSLMFLHGVNQTDGFYLGSNVDGAGAFDDIVMRYKLRGKQEYRACFVVLKHKSDATKKPIELKDICDVKGPFSMSKYYTSAWEVERNVCGLKYQKSVLFDVSFENCDFVIHTNAVVDSNLLAPCTGFNSSGLMLLSTGNNSDTQPAILSYLKDEGEKRIKHLKQKKQSAEEDKELKDLEVFLKAMDNDTGLKDFSKQLHWFTRQASQHELDALIQAEIQIALGLNEEDAKPVAKKFVEKMQGWWEKRGEVEVLTETAQLWRDIVVSRLDSMNEEKRKEKEALNINFTDQEIDFFNQSLSSNVINVTSPHIKLTCVKLSQVLEKYHTNKYIFMTQAALLSRKSEVLSLWQSVWCDVLLIECSTFTQSLADEMKTLVDELNKTSSGKRLIFLSQSALPGYQPLQDEFTCNQLEATSQKMLLEKKVDFQGREVSLQSVVGKQCLHSLVTQLLSPDTKLSFGKKIPDNISYYIPRSLQRSDYVKKEIFRSLGDYFIFSNVKEHVVTGLEGSYDIKLKKLDENQDNVSHHFYWTDDTFNADTFTRLCQKIPDKNVHWLSVDQDNDVYWKQSFNNMDIIREHIDKSKKRTITAEDLKDIVNERVVLVAAEPGMGKSTFINNVVQVAKNDDISQWTIRVDLNKVTRQLEEHTELYFTDQQNITQFLIEEARNCDLDDEILRSRLTQAGNVNVYLDGYDEISPYYNDKVTNMIKRMMELKVEQIWLTSRNVMRHHLERELGSICYSMKPFTHVEQASFLFKYWNAKHSIQINDTTTEFAENLLQKASQSFSDRDREFMGIPLQCMMLGEVFAEDVKRRDLNLPNRLDLLQLFETFIAVKLNILNYDKNQLDALNPGPISERKKEEKILMQYHSDAAILLLLSVIEIEFLKGDKSKITSNVKEDFSVGEAAWKGLVDGMTDGKPSFIHRCFAEYFLAWWLSENISSSTDFIAQHLFEPRFEIVRQFFDRLLARDCPLHNAVLSADRERVEALLTYGADVNQLDKSGRSALHLVASYTDNVPEYDKDFDPDKDLDDKAESIMKLLLNHDAYANLTDRILQGTPLRYAARMQLWGKVECLLKNKANTDDLVELRELINTAKKQDDDIDQGNSTAQDDETERRIRDARRTCHSLVERGCFHILQFAVDECGLQVNTRLMDEYEEITYLLHAAAVSGREDSVKFLLDRGADMMLGDRGGMLPIHRAARASRTNIIPLLIESGINVKDEDQDTPLHYAAERGRLDTVKWLVDAGAEVDAKDWRNETPLHRAVEYKHVEVAKYLIEKGADVNAKDRYDVTPLHRTAQSGEINTVMLLLKEGAELNAKTKEHVRYIADTYKKVGKETPLHWAMKNKYVEVARYLIEKGADQHCADSNGRTPANMAQELCPEFMKWLSSSFSLNE